MTATYDDAMVYKNAVRLLSSPRLQDRLKASAIEYAEWIVKNDPRRLHSETYAASDFTAKHKRFDLQFNDDLDFLTFEDYHASRYFTFPLNWITSPEPFKKVFLEEVAEKTAADDLEKTEKKKKAQAEKYKKYLKLKEEFEGMES